MTSKIKWSIYFELEYTVMQVIRRYMIDRSIKFFLEHDGWSCDSEIDTNDLCDYVREITGYKLKFDYENLTQYDDDTAYEIQDNLCETTETKETTNIYCIPLCSGSHKIVTENVASKKKALTAAERQKKYRQKQKQKEDVK